MFFNRPQDQPGKNPLQYPVIRLFCKWRKQVQVEQLGLRYLLTTRQIEKEELTSRGVLRMLELCPSKSALK